ncbi:uncharacterized protein LOC131888958 isoform X2 [Tigriopus californicus]|nr:uncharacterized protein LOC131888958 isoform X2 [Tigriopus californicus]
MPEFIMGSYFFKMMSKADDEMAQPRTLEELLRDFSSTKIAKETDLNQVVESKVWSHKFREHLRKNTMTDEETLLKFLVLTQPLQANHDICLNKKRKPCLSKKETEILVKRAVMEFFSENSEEQLCLSNQDLFQSLFESSKRLARGGKVHKDDLTLLLTARTDLDVWYDGLEPEFMRFIQRIGPSAIACILSIL